jgi:integrase
VERQVVAPRTQIWRTIGPAWREPDGAGGWRPRRGRPRAGYLTEPEAIAAMLALIAEHDREQTHLERDADERHRRGATFREVAAEWLEHLERVKGAKPSTLSDYRSLLAEPGMRHRRGPGMTRGGRLMAAFGERPICEVDVREVDRFLRDLDRAGLTPRTVNKNRQILSAIFNYARRPTTYALPTNPVEGTDKRREAPPIALDFHEPEEVEALARAAAAGRHRGPQPTNVPVDEVGARSAEDAQDAELFRVLAHTGLRLGEAVTLRWSDVDFNGRRLIVQRAMSGDTETTSRSSRERPGNEVFSKGNPRRVPPHFRNSTGRMDRDEREPKAAAKRHHWWSLGRRPAIGPRRVPLRAKRRSGALRLESG